MSGGVQTAELTSGHVSDRRPWPAWAAAACAGAYAGVSLYWALGGTAGLGTLGGSIEHLARSRDAGAAAVIWATVAVKGAGAALALSLCQRWGRVVPHRWRAWLAGSSSVVLVVYGGANMIGETLFVLGVAGPAGADRTALHWHLALWDPWFLLWGLLLGATTWRFVHCREATR